MSLSPFRLQWRSFGFVPLFIVSHFVIAARSAAYRSIARYRDESGPERDPRDGAGLSILGNGDFFFLHLELIPPFPTTDKIPSLQSPGGETILLITGYASSNSLRYFLALGIMISADSDEPLHGTV